MKLNKKIIAVVSAISLVTATAGNSPVPAGASGKPSVPGRLTVTEGKKKTIRVKGSFIKSKSFKSTDKKVAVVNKKGVITALSKGKCKIKVTVKYHKSKKAEKVLKKEFVTKITVKAKKKPKVTKKPEITKNPSAQVTEMPEVEITKKPAVTDVPANTELPLVTVSPENTKMPQVTPPAGTPSSATEVISSVAPEATATPQIYYPIYIPPVKHTSSPVPSVTPSVVPETTATPPVTPSALPETTATPLATPSALPGTTVTPVPTATSEAPAIVKNAADVEGLKKLIQQQRAVGATVSEDLDSEEYTWSEDGRLTGILWEEKNLQGELYCPVLNKLLNFDVNYNELTSLDVSGCLSLIHI